MDLPSEKEVLKFMRRESKPYKFEFAKDIQPLRVNVERKIIYVNKDVLMNEIMRQTDQAIEDKQIELYSEKLVNSELALLKDLIPRSRPRAPV